MKKTFNSSCAVVLTHQSLRCIKECGSFCFTTRCFGTKSRFHPKCKHTVEYLSTGLKGWRHAAQRRVGDELITYFSERVWWRWMPPLATRIHTSVIHLATSHRTDPLSHVLSHLAPCHSTLHVLSVRYVSLYLSLSSHGAHGTHQEQINRITA